MEPERALLTAHEAADRLRICERTLRKLRQRGEIAYIALTDRLIMYDASDCDRLLEEKGRHLLREGRELPAVKPRPGAMVYYIRSGTSGAIKIGHSSDVARRLMDMQVGHPEPLTLVGMERGALHIEKERHRRFAQHHLRGEWFSPADPLLDHIETLPRIRR